MKETWSLMTLETSISPGLPLDKRFYKLLGNFGVYDCVNQGSPEKIELIGYICICKEIFVLKNYLTQL